MVVEDVLLLLVLPLFGTGGDGNKVTTLSEIGAFLPGVCIGIATMLDHDPGSRTRVPGYEFY